MVRIYNISWKFQCNWGNNWTHYCYKSRRSNKIFNWRLNHASHFFSNLKKTKNWKIRGSFTKMSSLWKGVSKITRLFYRSLLCILSCKIHESYSCIENIKSRNNLSHETHAPKFSDFCFAWIHFWASSIFPFFKQ